MTPLHVIGNTIREVLAAIPMPVVRGLFLAVLIGLLIWVLRLPQSETTAQSESGRTGMNLKWGAALAILLQIVIYAIF
ncbi:hypothetical protein [Thalassoroseus pseudoceratinae]|uniref:hypothetical protein n=1 Tax=Thalassoroseus pseudoceratinae TaxID=2713176 RepID=UPI0014226BD2|nr:hypothetical protein [Thalassoroseus pseudoceratinae]